MTSKKYWALRSAQDMFDRMGTAEQTAAEISAAVGQSSEYLAGEVRAVLRGMQSFGISEAEAMQIINAAGDGNALQGLRRAAQRVNDPVKRNALMNAINSAGAYRYRIERIGDLYNDIDSTCRRLYQTENRLTTYALRTIAEDSYYHEIFNLQQGTGLNFSFSKFSQTDVDRILRANWLGGNYSQRIWKDMNSLTEQLKRELMVSMLTGRSGEKTARIFQERFGVNAFCARRIVRTESAYVANAAQMCAYDEAGIDKYRFVATLDKRTSEVCAALDGKVFPTKDAKPGKNYPPMHPFCRSTTIADFGENMFADMERRAKDADGNAVKVPADMTYDEWYRKFVENKNGVSSLAESIDKPAKSDIIKSDHKADTESDTRYGSNLFDISSKEALVNSEKEIAANDFETALIYSESGERIFDYTNGSGTIHFSASELQKIPSGAVITHNHPNGTVPSPEDVAFLLNRDISEIRACNNCGAYVIRKTPKWDNLSLKLDDISKEFYDCSNSLSAEYNERAAKEGKSIFDYLCEIDERSWKTFCDNHGLEFIWEERI